MNSPRRPSGQALRQSPLRVRGTRPAGSSRASGHHEQSYDCLSVPLDRGAQHRARLSACGAFARPTSHPAAARCRRSWGAGRGRRPITVPAGLGTGAELLEAMEARSRGHPHPVLLPPLAAEAVAATDGDRAGLLPPPGLVLVSGQIRRPHPRRPRPRPATRRTRTRTASSQHVAQRDLRLPGLNRLRRVADKTLRQRFLQPGEGLLPFPGASPSP
jgi:hypothetical protein